MRLIVNKSSDRISVERTQTLSKAFTLIEILVVAAITGLLVTISLTLSLNILKVWNESIRLEVINQQAGLALDLLARDLESSVMKSDGNEWLRAVREEIIENENRYTNATWMMFFSQLPDRDRVSQEGEPIYGDICAVSYRLGYQNPLNSASSDFRTLGLYRTVMDAETTFSEALDLSAKGKSYYRDFWLQRSSQTTREEYLIISNLIDFRLHFTFRDAKGSLQYWDAEKDFIFGGPEGNVGGYLVYVDIEIKVLNPSEVDSSSPTKNNSKTIERDQLVLSEAQRYHRRVVFPSYPF